MNSKQRTVHAVREEILAASAELRAVARSDLYRGGMGSFSDVGTEASSRAVNQLRAALRRGRSWFLHNSRHRQEFTPRTLP